MNERAVGFTGTQQGMSPFQFQKLLPIMESLRLDGFDEFHHGDCIGADEQAHNLALNFGFKIVVHPPDDSSKRANVHLWTPDVEMRKALPYLKRNRVIVLETAELIAVPHGRKEVLRSGTWATVRYHRSIRPADTLTVVLP